jgi:hypothetical protein
MEENNNTNLVKVDERVSTMYDMVLKMKTKLNDIKDINYKTNGLFRYNPSLNANGVKIQTENRIHVLLSVLGFILSKAEEYNNAAKTIELKEYPLFKWLDYTAAEWTHDIKLRIAFINHKDELAALSEAESTLADLLTKDERTDRKLNELAKKLNLNDI